MGMDLPMMQGDAGIVGVGTAVAGEPYSQAELLDLLGVADRQVRSVFLNSAIERRFLTVPPPAADRALASETQGQLLAKHKWLAVDMGTRALKGCLKDAGLDLAAIDYLCCVTTTGFLTPGLSAMLIQELGIDPGCHRVDVVGMGCNAGLNALNAMAGWSVANPRRVAVMVCVEACSAAYVVDGTMRTADVNSLFGDGAAAIAVTVPEHTDGTMLCGPRLLGFASHIITDAIGRCGTTGMRRRASSASSLTQAFPMWSAHMPSGSLTACWRPRGCGGARSRTGWCTRAARRSSTQCA
jgi:3,5-dihydroxyphenylacetyl-CoA synthase